MKKIIMSAGSLIFAGALVVTATGAFFSDTETSTGNTFTAGAIDLQIDNSSYVLSSSTGQIIAWPGTSWSLTDLTVERFFDFIDLKPGDFGEDTISIHVDNNDAWLCAAAQVTSDLDNGITEPEDEVSLPNNDDNDGTGDGDLDSEVNFAFWADDGDNVLETGENIFLAGPVSALGGTGQIALSDSSGTGPFGSTPVPGGTTQYVGKAWCFGTLTPAPITQDGVNTGNPTTLGSGFTCNGASVGNISQTDSLTADLQFYAVQSRNNLQFTCAANYTPVWPQP